MSRPRFLADADIRREIIQGVLRLAPAAEFESVRRLGMGAADDRDILAFAALEGWIVVSHDQNTMTRFAGERMKAGLHMRGLIIAPQSRSIGLMVDSLVLIWEATDAEEWENRIQFLPV